MKAVLSGAVQRWVNNTTKFYGLVPGPLSHPPLLPFSAQKDQGGEGHATLRQEAKQQEQHQEEEEEKIEGQDPGEPSPFAASPRCVAVGGRMVRR